MKIITELGRLLVEPYEIVVIPQGIRFSVQVDGPSRGYVLEVFGAHFQLPDLGPIGANGLANPHDFLTPTAWFDETAKDGIDFKIINKYQGTFFEAVQVCNHVDSNHNNSNCNHENVVSEKYRDIIL